MAAGRVADRFTARPEAWLLVAAIALASGACRHRGPGGAPASMPTESARALDGGAVARGAPPVPPRLRHNPHKTTGNNPPVELLGGWGNGGKGNHKGR